MLLEAVTFSQIFFKPNIRGLAPWILNHRVIVSGLSQDTGTGTQNFENLAVRKQERICGWVQCSQSEQFFSLYYQLLEPCLRLFGLFNPLALSNYIKQFLAGNRGQSPLCDLYLSYTVNTDDIVC